MHPNSLRKTGNDTWTMVQEIMMEFQPLHIKRKWSQKQIHSHHIRAFSNCNIHKPPYQANLVQLRRQGILENVIINYLFLSSSDKYVRTWQQSQFYSFYVGYIPLLAIFNLSEARGYIHMKSTCIHKLLFQRIYVCVFVNAFVLYIDTIYRKHFNGVSQMLDTDKYIRRKMIEDLCYRI